MIILKDVHKRYNADQKSEKWVLKGVSFTIPLGVSVGLVGESGSGKSTLLRLIGGIEAVSSGRIVRRCRVSWPMGFAGALRSSLTGRQNARFIFRIQGHTEDIEERLAYLQDFSELGADFDKPLKSYTAEMKGKILFSLFIASDFDVYLSDVGMLIGAKRDLAFKTKAIKTFKTLTEQSGVIMTAPNERILKQFCSAGIWLHEGQAHWFDNIDDALKHHKESSTV